MTVLFVGRSDIGTRSHKVLLSWIAEIGLKEHKLVGGVSYEDRKRILQHAGPIVALGNNAAKVVADLGLYCFKLPHPTGLDKVVNDKVKLRFKLLACKEWLST